MLGFWFIHWYTPPSAVFLALRADSKLFPIILASASLTQSSLVETDCDMLKRPRRAASRNATIHGYSTESSERPLCCLTMWATALLGVFLFFSSGYMTASEV
jgi:hypothetical protein